MTIALLILVFTLTDTATTLFGLYYLGGVELNPVYHAVGPAAFWILKWAGAILFAAFAWVTRKDLPAPIRWILMVGVAIPATASLSNAINIALWSWGIQ